MASSRQFQTATATVRGIPCHVLVDVKARAFRNGVIPTRDGSASDAIRWALVQFLAINGTAQPEADSQKRKVS